MSNAAGAVALDALWQGSEETQKTIAAEEAAVRRRLYGDSPGADDMGDRTMVLGDQVVNHTHVPQVPRKTSGLLKAAVIAALAGTPIGLGVAALPIIAEWLKPQPQQPQPQLEDTDTDTRYELELVPLEAATSET